MIPLPFLEVGAKKQKLGGIILDVFFGRLVFIIPHLNKGGKFAIEKLRYKMGKVGSILTIMTGESFLSWSSFFGAKAGNLESHYGYF